MMTMPKLNIANIDAVRMTSDTRGGRLRPAR